MKVVFLEAAQKELEEAVAYYDARRQDLGDEFATEVERAASRLVARPTSWALLSPRARGCRTRRFPYQLVYQIREQEILIVAVMHQRRRPGYWEDRISKEIGLSPEQAG
jgi:plasmid stabilization system protein ParE